MVLPWGTACLTILIPCMCIGFPITVTEGRQHSVAPRRDGGSKYGVDSIRGGRNRRRDGIRVHDWHQERCADRRSAAYGNNRRSEEGVILVGEG